jgi:hypothetical protein
MTSRLFQALAGLVLAAASLQPGTADALTFHAGDVVTFNVDFTGQNPPPPYLASTSMQFVFSDVDIGDRFTADIFGGLNHTGTLIGTLENMQVGSPANITSFAPENLDGIYSIRLTALQGEFELDDVWAEARNEQGGLPALIAPVSIVTAVPEPTTLALFGTVGALAALHRRRRIS